MRRSAVQRIFAAHHGGKRQDRFLAHAEREIKIAQADVRVDTEHLTALRRETGGDPGAERGFARTALAGDHGYDL